MSLFSRLFGTFRSSSGSSQFISAQRKVLDYARFIERCAPMPGTVADASLLPHPKQELKTALITCLGNNSDQQLAEHLRHGYLMLSAWQDNVGDRVVGMDFAGLDLEADPLETATRLEQQSEAVRHWQGVVELEQAELRADLQRAEARIEQRLRLSA
jgi:hypothetical protein